MNATNSSDTHPTQAKSSASAQRIAITLLSPTAQSRLESEQPSRQSLPITSPAKPEVHDLAAKHKRRYVQVNQRIKVILPDTLELYSLLYEVKEDEPYVYADPAYRSFQEWAAAEHKLANSSEQLHHGVAGAKEAV